MIILKGRKGEKERQIPRQKSTAHRQRGPLLSLLFIRTVSCLAVFVLDTFFHLLPYVMEHRALMVLRG